MSIRLKSNVRAGNLVISGLPEYAYGRATFLVRLNGRRWRREFARFVSQHDLKLSVVKTEDNHSSTELPSDLLDTIKTASLRGVYWLSIQGNWTTLDRITLQQWCLKRVCGEGAIPHGNSVIAPSTEQKWKENEELAEESNLLGKEEKTPRAGPPAKNGLPRLPGEAGMPIRDRSKPLPEVDGFIR